MKCQRCSKETDCTIMSMYSTAEICMNCKDVERKRPDYAEAVKADERAYLNRLKKEKLK